MNAGSRNHARNAARLLDLAREALVVLAPDGALLEWNAGAERIFGFTREQAVGRTLRELLGPGAALDDATLAQLHQGGAWTGELFCVAADATIRHVDCDCSMPDASLQGGAICCAMTDITEHRRAEKEIILLNNMMERRIRKRTEQLEESNEDLRGFAYSLAHDLRAPLASIDGFSAQLEMRLSASLGARERHYLQRVRAGVKAMGDLTDALLALADVTRTQLLRQRVDLSALARQAIEQLREADPQREVVAVVNDTPPAEGDVRLLADVMQNLLGNAWKFTSRTRGARIEFGAAPATQGVPPHYYVKDNGAGFDPDYAHKLFTPFQRLHSQAEFAGTGIGLAVVRKIVSRHGGRVWAQSRPGEGATLSFTLGKD